MMLFYFLVALLLLFGTLIMYSALCIELPEDMEADDRKYATKRTSKKKSR